MKISKLHLKNGYKRFHDLTIDLGETPKRIVALIGPNGCGKSSVIDGILFHSNAHRPIGNKGQRDHFYHSMSHTPNFNHTNIEIKFTEGDFRTIYIKRQETGKENTIFSFRSPYRYNSNLKVTQSRATSEIRLNNYGASTAIDLDDKMEENYRRLYIKYNKYLNDTDCKPSQAKEKIIGDLNNSLNKCLDLKIISIGDIESNQGTIFFSKDDHPSSFDFNVLSSGEKEVVDILLDLYLRQDEYNDTVFLIDEPELHLSTAIQKKLLLEINKLVGPSCQIWIATHSIGFIRALQEELKNDCQIIYFKPGVNWANSIQLLKPIELSRANWKNIFHTALDDLTDLVSPKRIIYCEGKDRPGSSGQERGFDARVYNIIFSKFFPETLFVSSGGNTELDQRSEVAIAILTKVFSDIEILVLKDRDMSSGRLNTENDRQVYLRTNQSNHRVLKRWEIENYLFDKEVLKKFCSSNQLPFNEENYDSFISDVINQNIKDETGKIKNFCGITTSISQEVFKLQLAEVITPEMNIYQELKDCVFGRN